MSEFGAERLCVVQLSNLLHLRLKLLNGILTKRPASFSPTSFHYIKLPCDPFWWLARVSTRDAFFTGLISGGRLALGPWIN